MSSKDYVDLLVNEYLQRKNLDKRYSERAFARSLGLSAGYLKLLFQGKKNLSFQRAQIVGEKLDWAESKKSLFLKKVKNATVKNSPHSRGKVLLKSENFFEVSDWFHFAIIEFIKTKESTISAADIAEGLNISITEVNYALKNLIHIGLVQKNEKMGFKVPDRYEIPSVSSAGIRKYHKQTLQLASSAIETQPFDTRDFRALTLSFDVARMEEAKKCLEKFVADFDKKFSTGSVKAVYQLNTAFFRLDQEKS